MKYLIMLCVCAYGQALSMGIYMLLAECIAENGETEYLRHPITIFYD
jgi:hypothetical protein